jgi:hypothetical protein
MNISDIFIKQQRDSYKIKEHYIMKLEGKKAVWSEYQKEIADDNFFYVRSCIRQNFFPGSEDTFLKIMRDLLEKRCL